MDRRNFRFNFVPKYWKDVEETLYTVQTNPPHSVQQLGPQLSRCLLCTLMVSSAPRGPQFDEHLRTHHVNFVNMDCYHEAFMAVKRRQQLHQVYFRPHTAFDVFCCACNKAVAAQALRAHIRSEQHLHTIQAFNGLLNLFPRVNLLLKHQKEKVVELKEGKPVGNVSNGKVETAAERGEETKENKMPMRSIVQPMEVNYDENTMQVVYPACNVPRNERRPLVYVIQKRGSYFCICCNCIVYRATAIDHLSTPKHKQNLRKKMNALLGYHKFWMSKEPDLQLLQIYFVPQTVNSMTCSLCKGPVAFAAVENHKCFLKVKVIDKFSDEKLTDGVKEFKDYPGDFYPSVFSREASQAGHYIMRTSLPFFIWHQKKLHCLLCDEPLAAKYMVEKHLVQHFFDDASLMECRMAKLLVFHQFWKEQSLQDSQFIVHYRPLNQKGYFMCCEHKMHVPIDEVLKHAQEEHPSPPKAEEKPKDKSRQQQQRQSDDEDDDELQQQQNENSSNQHMVEKCLPQNGSLLPSYLKVHEQYLQAYSAEEARCVKCQQTFRLCDAVTHVSTEMHFRHVPIKVHSFTCDICNSCPFRHLNLFLMHLQGKIHKSKIEQLGASRKPNLCENWCARCRQVFFGDDISVLRHVSQRSAGKNKRSEMNLTPAMKQLCADRKAIEQTADQADIETSFLLKQLQPMIEKCIADFEATLASKFPNCKAYCFGSMGAGLCSKASDLDIFLDIGDVYDGIKNQDCIEQQKILLLVKDLLKKDAARYSQVVSINSARVPIIQVIHNATNIDCDLSFRSGLSVENTKLIIYFGKLQPNFTRALLFLKRWGAAMSPVLKEGMTSYALCMMLVFFLQTQNVLPSVDHLRRVSGGEEAAALISGWPVLDQRRLPPAELLRKDLPTPRLTTVADYVCGFFEHYASFNFAAQVVCPLLGSSVPVRLFEEDGQHLPPQMDSYRRNLRVDALCKFRTACHMFVQDPFDLGHNLTKGAPKPFVRRFATLCKLSATLAEKPVRGQ